MHSVPPFPWSGSMWENRKDAGACCVIAWIHASHGHTWMPPSACPSCMGACSAALPLSEYQAEKSATRLKLPVNFFRSKSWPIFTQLPKLRSLCSEVGLKPCLV